MQVNISQIIKVLCQGQAVTQHLVYPYCFHQISFPQHQAAFAFGQLVEGYRNIGVVLEISANFQGFYKMLLCSLVITEFLMEKSEVVVMECQQALISQAGKH
ncbi:hypothetical protein SDC9_119850 [bioreactor metagenome]|uniref:Uncharacterized protein n=1 Tax=bioreactor metagenome TaxID=1076179 RepID=A0A645C9K1_9ZZZZ